MSKKQQFKDAILNPPPGRLEKIEYRSHFLQILGVLFVCAILISRGFWWIIFAFIFSLGISYSQGVAAYRRYKTLMMYQEEYDPEIDKSPTRRADYVIKEVFGNWTWIWACIAAIAITYLIVPLTTIWWKISFTMILFFIYLILYYGVFYNIAKLIYGKEKG